jgi:hypothetical protein
MSRLTVHLPETLYHQLTTLAKDEEIPLNQYIVYALTRQVTLAYTVQTVPERALVQQRASFTALLQSLGQASFSEIEATMLEREEVELDAGLSPKVVARMHERLATDA